MDLILIGSFLLFMTAFAGIGLASMWVKEDTTDDYLVAGRGMHQHWLHYLRLVHGIVATCSSVSLDLLSPWAIP